MPDNATVVVKFHDAVVLDYADELEQQLKQRNIGAWDKVIGQFPGATLRRLFTALDRQEIEAMIKRASDQDSGYKAPNFFTYFVLDCPPGKSAEALVQEFRSWQVVQTAYVDPPVVSPTAQRFSAAAQPYLRYQQYLTEINAQFAWGRPGGTGAGRRVIDLEWGWTSTHQDLAAHRVSLFRGTIDDRSRPHGTAVLGVICADGRPDRCIGIAPDVRVDVVSHNGRTYEIADAIDTAVSKLRFGDVLVLEVAVGGNLPCETQLPIFQKIQLATAAGMVVVEAAGNAGADLDEARVGSEDSGAIMVGAAISEVPHLRLPSSNYGSRVNCYAWGEHVYTPTSDTNGEAPATDLYEDEFGHTSAATAIVAGVALAVQGMAEAATGSPFDPKRLRKILSNPLYGTPSGRPGFDRIGVMPDLKKIYENELAVAPVV